QLARVVAVLAAGRDERPERAGLEAVDPVHRGAVAVEAEGRCQQLAAEPARGELVRDRIDGRHLVLEIGVADDHPLEAERVLLPLERRPARLRDALDELLRVGLGLGELARRERLEDERARAGRLQPAIDVERQREEAVARRALQLLPAEEDVSETHYRPTRSGPSARTHWAGAPGSISLCSSPAPTSALRRSSSESTWVCAEICESSRSSCVRLSPISSSDPAAVSSSIADARACS